MDTDTLKIKVQSVHNYDVVVAGGGTTGTFAAIAAARGGARTAIVESSGFLGGTATCGLPWIAFHNFDEKRMVVKGIPFETIQRLQAIGGASDFQMDPILESAVYVNPHLLKIVLMQMAQEAGVKMYLHSLAGEVLMEGCKAAGVYIHNKQGCQLLTAKVIIDCTDSCDIAVNAGAEAILGRQGDNKTQVASTIFVIGDVDVPAMIDYFEKNPTQLRPHKLPPEELAFVIRSLRTAPLFSLGAFKDLIAQASAEGVNFPRETMIGIVRPSQREIMLVTPRVEGVNPADVNSFTKGENAGYSQIPEIMKFVNNYMPGGRNARIVSSGHTIGMRETKHVTGDYCLTQDDLVKGIRFYDTIALGAYYMDNHTPDNKGLSPMIQPPTYGLPYRSLLPKGLDGVLVAGRCLSATHEALAAVRVIPIAGAQGQAAGTAAALAARDGVTPRMIDINRLREQLLRDNVVLE